MKKSQIITILIIITVLLLAIGLFLIGNKQTALAPVAEVDVVSEQENNEIKSNTEILGNKDDLISFSIEPGQKVSGLMKISGILKGAYFFEGNILINVLDANKNVLLNSNAMAKSDWMTVGPIDFEGTLDFTNLPTGSAFVEIHNDNASGLPENDKLILIPIVIN